MTENLANKINDLRKLADERRNSNSLLGLPAIDPKNDPPKTLATMRSSKSFTPSRKTPQATGMSERPASRMEITSLEHELEERVRLVLDMTGYANKNTAEFSEGYSFEPHRESMMVVRERMLAEFGVDSNSLHTEPWLDSFIKCECLKVMCDEVSSKFADMLAVHSVELGSVLRKLRLTYKQSFEQMHSSWKTLRKSFLDHSHDLSLSREVIKKLQTDLENKENEMNRKFDNEVNRLNAEFNAEKARDQEKLLQTEFKMDQMSDTLKYLNGIFRTMQSDGATIKTADLQSKCYRLEKENFALQEQNASLETVNAALAKAELRLKTLEKENRQQSDEIRVLKNQLERREEVVKNLMEKEALRNAEIEKLQKMSKLKDDELVAVDLKDSATSVLCIKCKKSLDDLSNIRSAILGDTSSAGRVAKMQCETFRILLPNLKGRQPNRPTKWLRSCMRSILITKLKEDVHLQFIKGQTTRFPAFVYAWFVRKTEGRSSGTHLAKLLAAADEDRWGLYYGVKALSKDDPEALVFWSLLDETYGEDGMQFMLYCLSVLLSIGGTTLWKQFGSAMEYGSNINVMPAGEKNVVDNIWVDIFTAKEAVKLILVRALAAHVTDAMDAIDALKVRPSDSDLDIMYELMCEDKKKPEGEAGEAADGSTAAAEAAPETVVRDAAFEASNRNSTLTSSAEPTHINLFMWLRLMLQQIHADQIQRSAAVRLMFETASVGALTPQAPVGGPANGNGGSNNGGGEGSNGGLGAGGSHVEYPQFQSICVTLFPHVPITETAMLYANCYDVGQRRVSAETFVKVADRQGLFAHALKLPLLPLLKQSKGTTVQASASVQHITLVEEEEEKAETKSGKSITDAFPGFSLRTEQAVRSKLATMVHRKLAAVTPSIQNLLQALPERWHAVIEDAMDAVKVSLSDSHQKLKQQVNEQISHSYANTAGYDRVTMDESQSKRSYIDGLQPFVAYRRLLLLGSLIKTICDNPLLPSELFAAADLDNNALNIDHAMFRAEKLLTSIEQGFLLAPAGATGKGNTFLGLMDKYHSFETVRTRLVARRLQNVFRKFLSRDLIVPRSVRLCMTPGYLGAVSFATAAVEVPVSKYAARSASNVPPSVASTKTPTNAAKGSGVFTYEKLYLRNREVYHEPWWGQILVAEIYRYKITYDAKAASLGMNPIPLAQAVTAAQFHLWGTMELAETVVHDIFLCVRAYRLGLPRLRLFAAFLGDGRDLDEPVAEMLNTPHALSVYFNLLTEIHRELHREQRENLRNQSARATRAKELSEMSAIVENPESTEATTSQLPTLSFDSGNVINVLFPSTENALKRADKKDVWNCPVKVLIAVTKRWAHSQKSLSGAISIYTELPEKLRPNALEQVEVDDYLWIMMIQWAKLAAWHVKRSTKTTGQIEKTYLTSKYDSSKGKSVNRVHAQLTSAVKGGSYGRHQILTKKATYHELPLLPVGNLRTVVESAYHPGEGRQLSDTQHYVAEFVQRIGLRKNALKLTAGLDGTAAAAAAATTTPTAAASAVGLMGGRMFNAASRFTQEMEKLMHDCVLWDTNNLDEGYMRCLQLVHCGNLVRNAAGVITTTDGANKVEDADSLLPEGTMVVLLGYNPELAHALVKSVFVPYQAPVKQFMEEFVFHLEEIASPDLEAKYNAAAGLVQALGERFYPIEQEYNSYKVYAHEADCTASRTMDLDVRLSVESSLQLLTPLQHLEALEGLRTSMLDSVELWQKWQALISLLAEMAIATKSEVPHDSWQRGTKTHVDRALVYGVTTKNAP